MDRQPRRRQVEIARQNRFYSDYMQHLPEMGPDVLGRPGITHVPDL